MNLYNLRYFVTLAHLEHYTNAAKTLDITQPSLSHAISTLEEELGVKLFEKKGRNVYLTKHGRVFLEDVENIIEQLDSTVLKMKMASRGSDTLDVAFLRTLGVSFVPTLLNNFSKRYSNNKINYRFHCESNLSVDIITMLKDKKIDVAFCSKIDNEPSIEYIQICKEKLVAIVPYNHPLTKKEHVTLFDTIEYPHVLFKQKSGLHQTISNLYLDTTGKMPPCSCQVEEDQVVAGLVANEFGIAIVPYMNVLKDLPLKIIEMDELNNKRFFYLCFLKNSYQPQIVKDLIEFTKEYCKNNLEI